MRLVADHPAAPISATDLLAEIGFGVADQSHISAMEKSIAAAVDYVEVAAARPIGSRLNEFTLRGAYWLQWWFPVAPVQEVRKVERSDDWITWRMLDPTEYALAMQHDEPHLVMADQGPCKVTKVTAMTGFVLPKVPPALVQAVALLAKDNFETARAIDDKPAIEASVGIDRLIRQHRYVRPAEFA
ncbi:hypothetical protein [Palleronia sp. LCG004]|uniref:hypothetical protein n=1 Tax=Palleronia sp. LCG004 TaxID=3079304 RepID=UPI00294267F9|nr:hypothetical protein [Palleronia sp. LCG004]WOI54962.1 hypothetical protein RVY76_07745 [Palleronia sp. LCG004]